MPIFNPLLTTDRRSGIQQVQILLNLWLVYIRVRLRQFFKSKTKNTTLAISDYNILSILPLNERLNYNKGVLMLHKIMTGKVPFSLTAKFSLNQSRYSGKLNIPVPRTDIFKSSLV